MHEPNTKYTYFTNGQRRIAVDFMGEMNGGGHYAGKHFTDIIHKFYPNRHFKNCLEWCSGPGFIGFELLSHNLCSELSFMDIYKPALNCIVETIQNNQLSDTINLYNIGKLADLPEKKYDLVVGNPPWHKKIPDNDQDKDYHFMRRNVDEGLIIHKEFFDNISNFLNTGAIVIISATDKKITDNDNYGVTMHDFYSLAKNTSLKLMNTYYESTRATGARTYYAIFEAR